MFKKSGTRVFQALIGLTMALAGFDAGRHLFYVRVWDAFPSLALICLAAAVSVATYMLTRDCAT